MPLAVRERIAADIREIAADPAIVARLGATGQVVNPGTPAEFAAALDDQRATVAKIGETLGYQAGAVRRQALPSISRSMLAVRRRT